MKRAIYAVCLLVSILAISFTAIATPGCAAIGWQDANPSTAVYFNTQELYIASVSVALSAKQAGSISQAEWDDVYNPAIQDGNGILDLMESVNSDDLATLQMLRSSLNLVIERINGGA